MNKYLEKIAGITFSNKKEEPKVDYALVKDRVNRFMNDSHNLYVEHFNRHNDNVKKQLSLKSKSKSISGQAYFDAITSKVHGPELKKDHKALHDVYASDMAKLGNPVASHEYAYKDFTNKYTKLLGDHYHAKY